VAVQEEVVFKTIAQVVAAAQVDIELTPDLRLRQIPQSQLQ
jgi:hypothetical protein